MVRKMSKLVILKPKRPGAEGYKVLKEQIMIFSRERNTDNSFEITKSDVEDAQFAAT